MSATIAPNPPPSTRSNMVKSLRRAGDATPTPDLRPGADNAVAISKGVPSASASDYLPEEVLFALTQPAHPTQDKMGPVTRYRNLNTTSVPPRKAPANVWHHKRSDKLKHLTDQTLCLCGAGRDISFLYDIPYKPEEEEEAKISSAADDLSRVRHEGEPPKRLQLPSSLVPEEYHIVKSKGVLGLEYYRSDFTTLPEDHESHLVVFPSMKPTSRYEVAKLKETMEDMLEKAGVNDEEVEYKGPTQMHNLVELVKKEQKIYNIVFHEIIRQVTVECAERGELLAELRSKYSTLLSKVPRQIRSLHEEVMAQRALDRRLTEELLRFKSQIGALTSELAEVRERDKVLTEQAAKTQQDLHSALEESQRNASLLNEYHELYELQRLRLEKIVTSLSEEKELWSSAAYSLAIKVIEESGLATAKRLHVAEKSWSRLAQHFTVLLGDKDTEVLTKMQTHVEKWLDQMKAFDIKVKSLEDELRTSLKKVRSSVEQLITEFKRNSINKDGQFVKGPDADGTRAIYNEIKDWSRKLQSDVDLFSGMVLLTNNEALTELEVHMHGWTECGSEVFSRHKTNGGYPHEYHEMKALNEKLQLLYAQYSLRVTGENGVVKGILSLCSAMESWENKLVNSIHAAQAVLLRDWMAMYENLNEWIVQLDQINHVIGTTEPPSDKRAVTPKLRMDVHELMRKAHMWSVSASSAIDSEDSKMIEQVSSLHTAMIRWMVHMLLHLAPDKPGTSEESRQVALLMCPPIPQLLQEASALFTGLDSFSIIVFQCCESVVKKRVQVKQTLMEEGADKEMNDLTLVKVESLTWIHTANLMLSDLAGETVPFTSAASQSELQAQTAAAAKPEAAKSDTAAVAAVPPSGRESTGPPKRTRSAAPPPPPASLEQAPPESSETEVAGALESSSSSLVTVVSSEAALAGRQPEEATVATSASLQPSGPAAMVAPSAEIAATWAAAATAAAPPVPVPQQPQPSVPPPKDVMQVIGYDLNTRLTVIREPSVVEVPLGQTGAKKAPPDEDSKRFDSFVTVEKLQARLLDAEERALTAENQAHRYELDLKAAAEAIRRLERQLEEAGAGGGVLPQVSQQVAATATSAAAAVATTNAAAGGATAAASIAASPLRADSASTTEKADASIGLPSAPAAAADGSVGAQRRSGSAKSGKSSHRPGSSKSRK